MWELRNFCQITFDVPEAQLIEASRHRRKNRPFALATCSSQTLRFLLARAIDLLSSIRIFCSWLTSGWLPGVFVASGTSVSASAWGLASSFSRVTEAVTLLGFTSFRLVSLTFSLFGAWKKLEIGFWDAMPATLTNACYHILAEFTKVSKIPKQQDNTFTSLRSPVQSFKVNRGEVLIFFTTLTLWSHGCYANDVLVRKEMNFHRSPSLPWVLTMHSNIRYATLLIDILLQTSNSWKHITPMRIQWKHITPMRIQQYFDLRWTHQLGLNTSSQRQDDLKGSKNVHARVQEPTPSSCVIKYWRLITRM